MGLFAESGGVVDDGNEGKKYGQTVEGVFDVGRCRIEGALGFYVVGDVVDLCVPHSQDVEKGEFDDDSSDDIVGFFVRAAQADKEEVGQLGNDEEV